MYEFIVIRRDGVEVATLPGNSTTHTEAVDPGSYSYSIRGIVSSIQSDEQNCQLTRNPLPVSNLDCQFSGGTATLVWSVENGLSAVEVSRDGLLLATLPGNASFYQETSPPGGLREYSVTVLAGSLTAPATDCTLSVPPAPVSGLSCISSQPLTANLGWNVSPGSTALTVSRNGVLIATLPGGVTAYTLSLIHI